MKPVISVNSVSKYYGEFPALDKVSFQLGAGEAAALWGPNGAGKTTIMRCLLGLAKFEGSITINGFDPVSAGQQARAAIGYVPQDLPVQPLTVGEMVTYIAKLKRADPEESLHRLTQLGIEAQVNKEMQALSGGMKQRLALALALIGTPSILLLDEPTANLDAKGRAELLQLLHELRSQGMTLLFSSHRPEDVLALADRILLLDGGVLEQEQTPQGFRTSLGNESRLVVFLRNGHRDVAIDTLTRLGLQGRGEGRVVTVAIRLDQKADVLSSLARDGVDIEDFEWERYAWTEQ
ncbi:MAG: ABC transporter ATP-binding protein [Thermomicrobiales bacterium]|nr:ABC transporter ATP-binding protein [Thermomicrobiales bacterium]